MRKIILSTVLLSLFFIAFYYNGGVAEASDQIKMCRLDGKITDILEEYIQIKISKVSISNKNFIPCVDIKVNGIYQIKRDNFLRNAWGKDFFKGQDLIINGLSYSAMGPNGAVDGNGWTLESAGKTVIKLPISLGIVSQDILKMQMNLSNKLTTGQFYKISDLVGQKSQANEVVVNIEGYVVNKKQCLSADSIGCGPDGMLIVSESNSSESEKSINIIQDYKNKVDVSSIKVGEKYKFKIKTGGNSGSSIVLVSFEILDVDKEKNKLGDNLIENRIYTVRELNSNVSMVSRKFFTEAYVSFIYNHSKVMKQKFYIIISDDKSLGAEFPQCEIGSPCSPILTARQLQLLVNDEDYNFELKKKYHFEISVRNISNTNIPKNEFVLVSMKNLNGEVIATTTIKFVATNDQSVKKSFIARFTNWFLNLFRKSSVKETGIEIDNKNDIVEKLFDDCGKKQAVINTPMAPDCYVKALKDNNFSTKDARDFLMKKGIDVKSFSGASDFWKEAWNKYYGVK